MTEPNLYDVGFENGFKLALARIEELEAKLEKAVETLKYYNVAGYEGKEARETLAELTGGKDE